MLIYFIFICCIFIVFFRLCFTCFLVFHFFCLFRFLFRLSSLFTLFSLILVHVFCCFNALVLIFNNHHYHYLLSLRFCFVSCSFLKQDFVWFVFHLICAYSVFHCFCLFYDCFFFLSCVYSSFHSIWTFFFLFNLSRFIVLSLYFIHFWILCFFFHLLLYVFFGGKFFIFKSWIWKIYIHIE